MTRARTLGLMLVAVFAFSALLADAAPAAEGELLNAFGFGTSSDTGTATFESTGGGVVVKCKKSAGEVVFTSNIRSKFTEHFKECTAAGLKCTGLLPGEATGEITMSGATEVLAFKNGASELKLAIVYTIGNLHFECAGVLTEVRGSAIGEITNANGEHTERLHAILAVLLGKEAIVEVNNVNHHLESETGGSTYTESGLGQAVETTGGAEVEVMY